MELGLEGRSALITGASKGIGLSVARFLAAEGCSLQLVSRTREDLETARDDIRRQHGVQAEVYAMNLAGRGCARELAAKCPDIDVLVNNAGLPVTDPYVQLYIMADPGRSEGLCVDVCFQEIDDAQTNSFRAAVLLAAAHATVFAMPNPLSPPTPRPPRPSAPGHRGTACRTLPACCPRARLPARSGAA